MKRLLLSDLRKWNKSVDRKPLILRGARQVGKTFLLKEFGKEEFKRTHYINFETEERAHKIFEGNLNPKRIIDDLSFYIHAPIEVMGDCLILDEIQACPRALTSLKYFCEEMPSLALCSAGSLLGISFGESSFPVGKVDFLDLYPLNFEEFLAAASPIAHKAYLKIENEVSELVHEELWQLLKTYFVVGGLPEAVFAYVSSKDSFFLTMEAVRKKQMSLIDSYCNDIAKHAGKINAMHTERVLRNIPVQLAKEVDSSVKRFTFKGVIPGSGRYEKLAGPIDWLITTGLAIKTRIIEKAQLPLAAYTKENRFKLYVFDVGILGALSGLSPDTILNYDYGSYKGYFAENFVAQELRCQGQRDLYAWSEGTSEVEFVLDQRGSILPIEVKSGNATRSKSLKVFRDKYAPNKAVVLNARPSKFETGQALKKMPLYLAQRIISKV